MNDEPADHAEKAAFTTVTIPTALRDELRDIRDFLAREGGKVLPTPLRAQWDATQTTADGRPRGNTGLSVVIELMKKAFYELVPPDAVAASTRKTSP